MAQFLNNLLTSSIHGSIVILAVILLRLILRKTPKKYICLLWLLAGIRLLMPIEIRSDLSLQPEFVLPGWNLPAILPWAWGIVAICFGIYSMISYMKLKSKVREAVRIRGGWECDRINTAFILGFIKPRIYIPMGMNRQARKHILAHERTHLDKGDHWIKMIGFLALALHWFNPLVWIAYIMLCKDIEIACDERVVQFMELDERKSYSAALLSCSGKQMHLSANPVAFGEVSVKQRILSVLNYKKPSFWISMLGVVAFFFVAVCLVTSPTKEITVEVPVAVPETTANTEEPTIHSTFVETLSDEEIMGAVANGVNYLKNCESYRAQIETHQAHSTQETYITDYTVDIYRYGDDKLELSFMDFGTGKLSNMNSMVYYGDLYGVHYGDYWVEEGSRAEMDLPDVDDWIDNYAVENKTITAVKAVDTDTVCFDVSWENTLGRKYTGTILISFRDDGTIYKIVRSSRGEDDGEGYPLYDDIVTIQEDPAPQETWRIIADHAMQCVTREELEDVRKKRNETTEIPSNKTDYDQDVSTGIISKQWEFLDKEWHCRIGSEDVTPTGLTQTFEESGDGHSSFVAEDGFWLETYDGTKWKLLKEPFELMPYESQSISVSWETKDTHAIDWTDSYGTLPEGYYRLGRYYTVTMADGRTQTTHCYSKFQIRNQDVEALLTECETGLAKLLGSTDYYLKNWDYLRNEEFHNRIDADSHDMVTEIWRSGDNFYEEITYRYKSDGSTKDIIAYLLRDGKRYCTKENTRIQTMEEAEFTEVDWLGQDNFELWSAFVLSFSPTDIVEVYKDQAGIIHVKESSNFYDGIPFVEQRYSFKSDGMLVWYQRVYFNEAGEEILDSEVEVYRTAEGETQEKIDSIAVN